MAAPVVDIIGASHGAQQHAAAAAQVPETAPCRSLNDLPPELFGHIVDEIVDSCRFEKNQVLALRLVSKLFDRFIKPYALATLQLEYSRFSKKGARPDPTRLSGFKENCHSIYCDMMVMRDQDEISRLRNVFSNIIQRVPDMSVLLDRLQNYCMGEDTFHEEDFSAAFTGVLRKTTNMTRLKLSLPFQVLGCATTTGTFILASVLECLAKRPEELEYKPLETLVLDHVGDMSVLRICNNPLDLANALKTMSQLKHLILSVKRQETGEKARLFEKQLWFILLAAEQLESLSLMGWNSKRTTSECRVYACRYQDPLIRLLPAPTIDQDLSRSFRNLRFLEIKRVNVDAVNLVDLLIRLGSTLKELYLSEVYLALVGLEQPDHFLWVGYEPYSQQPEDGCWVGPKLRDCPTFQLDILRATNLGYDVFLQGTEQFRRDYDTIDEEYRSIDRRFVEAVMNYTPEECTSLKPVDWDAEIYQRHSNPVSNWKQSIDGVFYNTNEQALSELREIIAVADKGMELLTNEINAMNSMNQADLEA